MSLGCAPPHCQKFTESVWDIIKEEAARRRFGKISLPGLELVPCTAVDQGGLAAEDSDQAFNTRSTSTTFSI